MKPNSNGMAVFLEISTHLTGYDEMELLGTGHAGTLF